MAHTPPKKKEKKKNLDKPVKEPARLMLKLAAELFPDEAERDEFIEALEKGESRDQAIIVLDDRPEIKAFPRIRPLKWQPTYIERIEDTFKPAKHPLYARGSYYSLDFSSVFAASAMLAMDREPKKILDMCSSPGGKAVFAYRTFKPDLLHCNDSMRNRVRTLIENLNRCKCDSAVVTSYDTGVFARKYRGCFDLVICDAPCSGQSMLAKGDEVLGCFAPTMIDMNVGRQRRITGNAYHCLRPGGYMLYMTCTFTPKENEKVMEWLLKEYSDLEAVEVTHLMEYRSNFSEFPSYRLFPHQGLGAGAFVCLLRRQGDRDTVPAEIKDAATFWKYGQELKKRQAPVVVETEAEKEERLKPLTARQLVKQMTASDPKLRKPLVKKPRKRRK